MEHKLLLSEHMGLLTLVQQQKDLPSGEELRELREREWGF
nr:hypothetical protein Q903MT_gene1383 [Picea sitchensis]